MNTIPLGSNGPQVSRICLGTMYFGIKTSEQDAHRFLDMYHAAGGRFLDTANKYATWVPGFPEPVGEKMLSRWLKTRGAGSEMFIATKLGFPYLDVPRGLTKELIVGEVEKSLRRLGVDTIHLLYAHADDTHTPQEETMEAFDHLVKAGKVRHLGASNFYSWRVMRANMLAQGHDWTPYRCVQTRLSLLWPKHGADFGNQLPASDDLIDLCRREKLGLLAYSPLLSGCYGRRDRAVPEQYNHPDNFSKIAQVCMIGEEIGLSGNQMVISWMLAEGIIPLVTGSTAAQISENLAAEQIHLPEVAHSALNRLFYGDSNAIITLQKQYFSA